MKKYHLILCWWHKLNYNIKLSTCHLENGITISGLGAGLLRNFHVYNRLPQTGLEKFQWFLMVFQDKKIQISLIILNVPKEKNTKYNRLHIASSDTICSLFCVSEKIGKSSNMNWWKVGQCMCEIHKFIHVVGQYYVYFRIQLFFHWWLIHNSITFPQLSRFSK